MPTKTASAAGWRVLVATFALIAFAFQSYLTQTHVHLLPATAVSSVVGAADSKTHASFERDVPKKAPIDDDPVKCPLCQAVGYAGHFVTPSAAASLLLPTAAISVLSLTAATLSPRETPSHIWRGRAPPHS